MLHEIVARPSVKLRMLHWCNRAALFASTLFIGEWGLYGAFRCPFVVPFVSCQNCPVITCPGQMSRLFWGFWGVWLAVALFFGRAFCGWLCPGSLVNRALALNPLRFKANPPGISSYKWTKYLMLAAGLTIWFIMGQPRVNVPLRIGEFWPSVWLTWEHAFPMWQLRLVITVAILALGLGVLMCWCRFACPFGAALELVRRFSFFRFYKTQECNDCDQCKRACLMRTRPDEENCTNCGDCVGSCPKDCIRFGIKPGSKA
ncbi:MULTISPECIES: 4Fe-4S binding protein [Desulfovibrio]|uniref:4Fe-4S binding domain-containing protein n=1 Tax=Desulfovibrio desulfuricans TaxID=876 RepID=A0AA94L1Z7_DESDE|nr:MULTISPECIES: 4Fe-4S binding protein [Desulfovibrio]ATD81920.1 4Fe-4S binding protein [Desulfovibrio sp. G11]SFW41176.1 4Fe-4S binding domain-containing protein [Desulfovibrio desulfuricans]SPD34665.1 4Fe-4S ferredoxin-type, iron-sulphur binding protein [Desulfovibrio sp. G11]